MVTVKVYHRRHSLVNHLVINIFNILYVVLQMVTTHVIILVTNITEGIEMATDFGKALRDIRKNRGMNLEEMAKYLDTTKQALSRYERGERTPKITVAASFAEKLGVDLKIFVGEDGSESMSFSHPDKAEEEMPKTSEARILAKGIDQLNPDQRAQALAVVKAMFAAHPEIFDD